VQHCNTAEMSAGVKRIGPLNSKTLRVLQNFTQVRFDDARRQCRFLVGNLQCTGSLSIETLESGVHDEALSHLRQKSYTRMCLLHEPSMKFATKKEASVH